MRADRCTMCIVVPEMGTTYPKKEMKGKTHESMLAFIKKVVETFREISFDFVRGSWTLPAKLITRSIEDPSFNASDEKQTNITYPKGDLIWRSPYYENFLRVIGSTLPGKNCLIVSENKKILKSAVSCAEGISLDQVKCTRGAYCMIEVDPLGHFTLNKDIQEGFYIKKFSVFKSSIIEDIVLFRTKILIFLKETRHTTISF